MLARFHFSNFEESVLERSSRVTHQSGMGVSPVCFDRPAPRFQSRHHRGFSNQEEIRKLLTGLLQLAAFYFGTIKFWSGFAGDF